MSKVIDIKETIERQLLDIPGVTGVGIGKSSPESINIYLKSACPKITCKIPEEIGGVPVKQIVTGKITSLAQTPVPAQARTIERTARERPYYGGMSIGSLNVSAGTLGVKCYDSTTREPLLLTNNHVGANESSVQVQTANVGDALLQPGKYDGGKYPEDVIGELVRGINIDQIDDNEVDGVVHSPIHPEDFSDEVLGVGRVTEIDEAEIGDEILISGRSSGNKTGTIVDVNATIKVDYVNFKNVTFRNQLVITPGIGQGGDSGSLVVRTRDRKAVGLLFAGSETITLANRMSIVAQALSIDLGSPVPKPFSEKAGGFWGTAVALGLPLAIFGIAKSKRSQRRL